MCLGVVYIKSLWIHVEVRPAHFVCRTAIAHIATRYDVYIHANIYVAVIPVPMGVFDVYFLPDRV